MELTFRKAKASDLPQVLELYRAVVENMLSAGIDQWGDEYPNREVLSADIDRQELNLCICEGKVAAAYVMNCDADPDYCNANWQYPHAKWCVVHRLCVSPAFHRRGLATAIMEFAESTALADGFEAIHLDTFSGNPRALALYHKLGFTDVGEAYWERGCYIIMEKKL